MSEEEPKGIPLEKILGDIAESKPSVSLVDRVRNNTAYVIAGGALLVVTGVCAFGGYIVNRQTVQPPRYTPTVEVMVEETPTPIIYETPILTRTLESTPTYTSTKEPTSTSTPTKKPTVTPTNTPIPPTPTKTPIPDTPPGSVLSVGDTWRNDGAVLTLDDYDLNVRFDRLSLDLTYTNNTGQDYTWLYKDTQCVNVVDNFGNTWKCSSDPEFVRNGETEELGNVDYLYFRGEGGLLTNPAFQYFMVNVNCGGIQDAKWRIPVYH